jgi:hypothetical protein
MVRATLLYDTVAARLNPEINVFKEFQKYSEDVARRTRRRILKCGIRQLIQGPDASNFVKLQQIADVGNGLLYRLQRFLEDPQFSFAAVAGKVYSAVRAFARLFLLCLGLVIAGTVMVGTYIFVSKPPWAWDWLTKTGLTNVASSAVEKPGVWFLTTIAVFWFLSMAVMVLAYGRRMYVRFGDLDD